MWKVIGPQKYEIEVLPISYGIEDAVLVRAHP